MNLDEQEVLAAADRLIADFGAHRRNAYFSHFAPAATFVFYTLPQRLESRAEYEAQWRDWEDSAGFRVHNCLSSERRVDRFGDVAVFSHQVLTEREMDGERQTVREQETIVFLAHDDGGWVAVHEHLSPHGG